MRKTLKLLDINLHLFDGAAGGAAGAATGGDGAAQGEASSALPKADTKTRGSSRRGKTGEFDNVIFGKQDTANPASENTNPAAEGTKAPSKSKIETSSDSLEAKRQAFEALIDGEYKEQFTERAQKIINQRFKGTKEMEASLNAQKPIMDMLMQRYQIADGDMAKLQKAIENDDSYWENAADEAGLTVEQYKAMQKLERENAELKLMRQRQAGEQQAQQRLAQWYKEAEGVKELYPTFDFKAETENKNFTDLLKRGLSVRNAYELIHMDEIREATARAAAQTAGMQVQARIQSKAARPLENGTSAQSAVLTKSDVHSLTKKERAEAARRAMRGEIQRF